jgi:epoxyqueuosine reductase
MNSIELKAKIIDRCRELGFALAGIADAVPTEYERELLDWLAAGQHGEMEYLRRNVELRIDPRTMVPGAKSVICVADRYDGETSKRLYVETSTAAFGRIARYARGDDYHVVMRKRLSNLCKELAAEHPGETFRACVDTAPVLEREIAQRAGIGAVGKNTLILERGVGSYLLLGEIITTLQLTASQPTAPDPCGTCTRCIDSCPTEAISPAGWSVDATRCISYLTIEHRGAIDERYHEAMSDWIFGCDICQEVCPHNQDTSRSRQAAVNPAYVPRRDGFDLLEILGWNEDARRAAFTKSAMKRARLEMMKRNALIAAGNAIRRTQNEGLLLQIHRIAQDFAESEVVRLTARQVLQAMGVSDRISHQGG